MSFKIIIKEINFQFLYQVHKYMKYSGKIKTNENVSSTEIVSVTTVCTYDVWLYTYVLNTQYLSCDTTCAVSKHKYNLFNL
jgi:hypothetical protein